MHKNQMKLNQIKNLHLIFLNTYSLIFNLIFFENRHQKFLYTYLRSVGKSLISKNLQK